MSKVKFNINTEYAYIQNMKILQSKSVITSTTPNGFNVSNPTIVLYKRRKVKRCSQRVQLNRNWRWTDTFTRHQIDRPVPVEALIKCKMQDNLEFLQWTKRYWDQYYPGGEYDAIARRKGSGAPPPSAPMPAARATGGGMARRGVSTGNVGRTRTPQSGGAASAALQQENNMLKETVAGFEKERDFYFNKLREIEMLIQQAVEEQPQLENEDGILKQIQSILYSTEDSELLFYHHKLFHILPSPSKSSFFFHANRSWAVGGVWNSCRGCGGRSCWRGDILNEDVIGDVTCEIFGGFLTSGCFRFVFYASSRCCMRKGFAFDTSSWDDFSSYKIHEWYNQQIGSIAVAVDI